MHIIFRYEEFCERLSTAQIRFINSDMTFAILLCKVLTLDQQIFCVQNRLLNVNILFQYVPDF